MTLRTGCKLNASSEFVSNINIETMSNSYNVYKMAAPKSDRSWCKVTSTHIIEAKLNNTFTPNVVSLSRQCKTGDCFDIDVFSTNEPCTIKFKLVSVFSSMFNHTSDEITISILPNNKTLPNIETFLQKLPTTQI